MSRIIAGSRGGQRIAMPPGDRARPTTDRVREALFSAIAAWAGTAAEPVERVTGRPGLLRFVRGLGRRGLEAASRGASSSSAGRAGPSYGPAQQAQRRSPRAGCRDRHLVSRTGAPKVCQPRPFDIVFADPPYELDTPTVSAQIEQLVVNAWVDRDSLIVVERSRRTPKLVWPDSLRSAGVGPTVRPSCASGPRAGA